MQITKLRLTNFRNYPQQYFEFAKYKNIIIGNNGMGKTNIVEAIYYLAITKSFRVIEDQSLINDNQDFAVIEGSFKNILENKFKVVIDRAGKKVFIDNNQIKKISDYISKLNIILFNQEDLKLIKDSPSIHRKLINMEISQLDNEYLKLLSNYNKILKQRNIYLKSMSVNGMVPREFLNILTDKLVNFGILIYKLRKKYIEDINEYLAVNFEKITKRKGLSLKYISNYDKLTKEELIKMYDKGFKKELNYGKTLSGIHLDDFIFYYEDRLAKNYLSEGEQKNVIIAFKLSEIKVFYNKNNTMPILILDDLFSEIDHEKINKIIRFFKKNIQIFITTTDLNMVDQKILNNSKVFHLKATKIEEIVYE